MLKEISPARFTLRKEYFGGLVHDVSTTKYELLQPEEYDFLSHLTAAENVVFQQVVEKNPHLKERVERFKNIGFIDVDDSGLLFVNVRLIPPPSLLPEKSLVAPLRVYDTYTQQCNLRCSHCYFSSSPLINEKRRTLEQTAEIMRKFYEAGTMEWRFTGGEPTIHHDVFDAITIVKGFGMNVSLNTNGWWSDKIAQKVLSAGLSEIVISLEGRQEVNDERRRKGAYINIIETFDRIAAHNISSPHKKISTVINVAVGRDNISDVDFLIRLAAQYGYNINFIPLKPSGRAKNHLQSSLLSTHEFMQFSRTVQKLREDPQIIDAGIHIGHKYKDLFCPDYKDQSDKPFPFNYSECGALTTAISMLPDGRVFACSFVLDLDPHGEFIGPNMISSSVEDAWFHPNIEKFRKAEKTGCIDCTYYMRQCRGVCKATVLGYGGEIKDGKLIGKDPYCYAHLLSKE
ncbi:MAG TPA: radical SAM protein [Patescibacteria group bacterium]|nr:radical SAM protein [Patescibacteria group bacterium]